MLSILVFIHVVVTMCKLKVIVRTHNISFYLVVLKLDFNELFPLPFLAVVVFFS